MNIDKKIILLIEDDPALNDAFSIMLSKDGFEVLSAFNGQEALEILASKIPALILLDLVMPIMDGKEFLKKFNNKDNIPIIVFSNLDSKDEVNEVLKLGATRYMLKAWASPKELAKIITDAI